MKITRTWKRDRSTNSINLQRAVDHLAVRGVWGRGQLPSDEEIARMLRAGKVLESPLAWFHLPEVVP